MAGIADDARTKSIAQNTSRQRFAIHVYDSVGNVYYRDAQQSIYPILKLKRRI